MRRAEQIRPGARKEGVLVQELADDMLVYDLEDHKAHCLNKMAALVWEQCDGKNSVQDIAEKVGKKLDQPVDEDLVWFALDQLGNAKLLDKKIAPQLEKPRMSRRALIKRAGIAAMIAIPVVTSILAPDAIAGTGSCGSTCASAADCSVASGCPFCPSTGPNTNMCSATP
jgi:hypothetical protein